MPENPSFPWQRQISRILAERFFEAHRSFAQGERISCEHCMPGACRNVLQKGSTQ